MSDSVTSRLMRGREERRREYRKRLPDHYCSACSGLTYESDHHCLECLAPRPGQGWTALSKCKDPWLGRVVDGRYLIDKYLGQGASARVYHAECLSFSRQFAIKIIDTSCGGGDRGADQMVARLNREVEALGRLVNPHIVSFYEVVELEGYSIATVMDFVDGVTLEEMVSKCGPLSVHRACLLLRQIANGLFEAHQMGMIHRDLKPENIMVERMPAGDDFVYVLDFGIVHVDDAVSLTQGFVGTPLYASPEQALGVGVDHRSDIYSLGAVMYFMLTGQPPFLSHHVYEVLQMHLYARPRPLCEANPDGVFPAELEEIVARMLAKKASERPDGLSQVIAELDLFAHACYSDAQAHSVVTNQSPPHVTELGGPSRLSATVASGDAEVEARRTAPGTGARCRVETPGSTLRSPRTMTLNLQITDTNVLAASTPGPSFALLDVPRQRLRLFSPHTGTEHTLQLTLPFAPLAMDMSSKYLVWGHEEGTISRMDKAQNTPEVLFQDVRRVGITAIATDPNDRLIVAGSASGRVYISHFENEDAPWGRMKSGRAVQCVAVSPGADTIAVAREGGDIEIFSSRSVRSPQFTILALAPVINMAISDDNYLLAVAMTNDTVVLYQTLTGKPIMTVNTRDRRVLTLDLTDNSCPLMLCEEAGQAVLSSLQQVNLGPPHKSPHHFAKR